jgi:hypothetical protein
LILRYCHLLAMEDSILRDLNIEGGFLLYAG